MDSMYVVSPSKRGTGWWCDALGCVVIIAVVTAVGCGEDATSASAATTDITAGTDAAATDAAGTDADSGATTDAGKPADTQTPTGDAAARSADSTACTPVARSTAPTSIDAARPARVVLPATWDGCKKWPLIVLLHGYSATGTVQDLYLGVSARATTHGFVELIPEGTVSKTNKQFWNATNACCNFDAQVVDDVAYVRGLIDTAVAKLAVDPTRVYILGHSNGGFMAYRMACEAADVVTGVASLAGAVTATASFCTPAHPVNVLQIHGTKDGTIKYDGTGFYPSAPAAVERWRGLNGCSEKATKLAAVDFDGAVAGPETTRDSWADCQHDVRVGLWTMTGSGHIPGGNTAFKDAMIEHILAWRRVGP